MKIKRLLASKKFKLIGLPLIFAFIFLILILIFYGALRTSIDGEGKASSSSIFDFGFDSEKYGYDDNCAGSRECLACKTGETCLQCMQNCYNKYANFQNEDNPYVEQAKACVTNCWEESFEKRKIRSTFDIPTKKNKKK